MDGLTTDPSRASRPARDRDPGEVLTRAGIRIHEEARAARERWEIEHGHTTKSFNSAAPVPYADGLGRAEEILREEWER